MASITNPAFERFIEKIKRPCRRFFLQCQAAGATEEEAAIAVLEVFMGQECPDDIREQLTKALRGGLDRARAKGQ